MKTVIAAAILFPMTFFVLSWLSHSTIHEQKVHQNQLPKIEYEEYCPSPNNHIMQESKCIYVLER